MLGVLTGPAGEVRVGYETAVIFGRWQLTYGDGGAFTLSAPVLSRNRFWLESGRSLDLCVTAGPATWRWRDVLVSGEDGALTVTGRGHPEIR